MTTVTVPQTASPPDEVKRVLIVDDHELLRCGLRDLINHEPDLLVDGEACDEQTTMTLLAAARFHVAVVDLLLGEGHALAIIRRIRASYPLVRVLVLSMHDDEVYVERVLRAGALGWVSKREPGRAVVDAIRSVMAGNVYLNEEMTRRVVRSSIGQPHTGESVLNTLSDRELQVLRLLGQGMTTGEIAGHLHLSTSTIDTYRERMKEKLGISTAAKLVRFAVLWDLDHT